VDRLDVLSLHLLKVSLVRGLQPSPNAELTSSSEKHVVPAATVTGISPAAGSSAQLTIGIAVVTHSWAMLVFDGSSECSLEAATNAARRTLT